MMRVRILAVMFFMGALTACATTSSGTAGQPEAAPSIDEFKRLCASELRGCRGPHTIRLLKEDGSIHEVSFDIGVPIVQGDDLVTVLPGETVYLEAEVDGDRVIRLRSVPEIVHPETTITISLSQSDGETDMFLVAKNPFPRALKYRMGMERLDHDGLLSTSSCPVVGGGGAYETWPHPIFQIVITDFRFLEEGAGFVCE